MIALHLHPIVSVDNGLLHHVLNVLENFLSADC
jgi:hypothetical protein